MARRRLTFRRLSGLDRSGPPPPQTLPGAPLNPWTVPNAIGFFRLALVPAFLVLALTSDDGTDALPAVIFAVCGWGDYADGIAARVTGQYSRLGTLLDPVIDRLLVLAGVIVCWKFALLPRWALAVLLAREAFVLLVGQAAVRRGIDLTINWPGRISVLPLMSALMCGLVGLGDAGAIVLYVGLFFSLWGTVLYCRSGVAQLRGRGGKPST